MAEAVLTGWQEPAAGPELDKAPTGIKGLDQITKGGLPRGRVCLVTGGPGTGKTLLGVEFLANGARQYGEPGVLLTFEESEAKIGADVRSLGIDLAELRQSGGLATRSFPVAPDSVVAIGEFDFEPLFLVLGDAIDKLGAKRVVLDTVEVLFSSFGDPGIVRAELSRLARWLEGKGVTAIITGERGDASVTRHGIEEYVSDCVIVLDHRVYNEVSTRRLRVVKYRGTSHGTNEYPFLISARGFSVMPVTSVSLDYDVSEERVSTGIARLDHMLGGGLYRGATVLVTGAAGTGKTSLGAHLADAACARGERALMVLFDESPAQLIRDMRSIGLDLRRWMNAGLLRVWAARPSAFGLETHLGVLSSLVEEFKPATVVLDGVGGLGAGTPGSQVTSAISRVIDRLKWHGITCLVTALGHAEEATGLDLSSIVDTWLLLRNLESNGERNRLLFVLKSRGTAHSNQVREFVLTPRGIELVDIYVGESGVITGSARLSQQTAERAAANRRSDEFGRKRRELTRAIRENEARLTALQDELTEQRAAAERIESEARRDADAADEDRTAMATQRWADPAGAERTRP